VVQGAVITDGVIVQRLTDYVWVGIDSVFNESHIAHVARVFYALKTSLEKLSAYYKSQKPTSDHPVGSRYFPSIVASPQGEVLVKFKYVGYLENGPDCVTLRAETLTEPAQDIVVKFVERYGGKAHRILADAGLAPKLLYYGSPHYDDDQPSYRSIEMVVMEYIDGDTLAKAMPKMNEESMKKVSSEVRRALELLHGHGLVFGDLRLPNIMITKDGEVKLIDFNWAGEGGQTKYPPLLSQEIAWPKGVKPLAVMKPEHDWDMWRKLF
jgi:serine/threonine protein kinase